MTTPPTTGTLGMRAWLAVLLLVAALPAAARADRQMDPELRGVLSEAQQPTDCFADRYERAVWFAYMDPRLSRYVKDQREREQILHHVHCEARGDANLILVEPALRSGPLGDDRFFLENNALKHYCQLGPLLWLSEYFGGQFRSLLIRIHDYAHYHEF